MAPAPKAGRAAEPINPGSTEPVPDQPLSSRLSGSAGPGLLGNTTTLVLTQGGGLVLGMVATPFFVSQLGFEGYGLWALVGAMATYAGLLDFGLGASIARFVAAGAQQDDLQAVRRVVTVGLVFYLALAAVLTPATWYLGGWVVAQLNLSADLVDTARIALVLAVSSFCLSAAVGILGALLTGLGLAGRAAVIGLVARIVFFASAITLLSLGTGILGLLSATFVQAFVGGLGLLVSTYRLIGNPLAVPKARGLRELLSFSAWVQVNNMCVLATAEADRLIIGTWASVRDAGFYDLGQRIALVLRIIPLALLSPLLPALTAASEAQDDDKFRAVFHDASRLLGLMSFSLGGFLVASSSDLVEVWLGRPSHAVVVVILILVPTFVLDNLSGPGTVAALARKRPKLVTEYVMVGVVLNILLTVILVQPYGLYGAVAGTAASTAASCVYFLVRIGRIESMGIDRVITSWLPRLTTATAVATAAAYLFLAALSPDAADGRLRGSITLLEAGVVYLATLTAALGLVRFFVDRDLVALRAFLSPRFDHLTRTAAVRLMFGRRSTR